MTVRDRQFTATVIAHLDPVLAPRGFPADHRQQPDPLAVLFHCDGPELAGCWTATRAGGSPSIGVTAA